MGIVYLAEVDFNGFNEAEKFPGEMVHLAMLYKYREKMETWSQSFWDIFCLVEMSGKDKPVSCGR
jgi:predicted NUDIX family phosphoesterase